MTIAQYIAGETRCLERATGTGGDLVDLSRRARRLADACEGHDGEHGDNLRAYTAGYIDMALSIAQS